MIKYLAKEKERDIQRRTKYLNVKCKTLGEDHGDHEKLVGTAGSMNY